MKRKYLYMTVFFSGMTTLAVELSASRLVGNYFGASNLVWASIIGLILIYLTAGYTLGGYWSDRSPHYRTFYQILLWSAFSIGLVPVIARPVLRLAAEAFDQLQMGILFGSFVAILVLFIVPITLLGTASPFALRLAIQDARRAGSLSGRLSALSTLGSFIGTFLPVLLLIPLVGTYRTFMVLALILLVVALAGLWQSSGWKLAAAYAWMPVVITILALVGVRGTDKTPVGLVYERESAYNYIQVLEYEGGYRVLRLNEGQGMHSVYHPTQLNFSGPWEQVLAAPFFNPAPYSPDQVTSMAIVGLAAGTTARQATAAYGSDIAIDGIEIDPLIVQVGREYFDMNQPNLNVIIQDGRWALAHSPRKYQVVSIDAYRPPYIPWHLTTREFFEEVRAHLTEDGVMVINVGRADQDRRLINAFCQTIGAVFPSLYVVDIPGSFNSIIYATAQPTSAQNLLDNLAMLQQNPAASPLLTASVALAVENMQPVVAEGQVFTDDLAPVEWITNNMVMEFFLSGDVEALE
jgi:spermidine synthase